MRTPRGYDAAIVGGGPAASALARVAAGAGLAVLLLERSDLGNVRIGESLDPSVQPLLRRLGLWDRFLEDDHRPAHALQSAWGSEALQTQSYLFNPHGHGWHVDRGRFDRMLNRGAAQAGATCVLEARLTDHRRLGPGGWELGYRCRGERHRARARLLVDATGRTSSLSRRLGIARQASDRLIGIAARYALPGQDRARDLPTVIESVTGGWWYAAPLPDETLIIVYLTDLDIAVRQHAHRTPAWQQRLRQTRHIAPLVGAGEIIGRPRVFPAHSQRVTGVASDGVVPVGDAFMALDPLCGQGVVHALQDAIDAAAPLRECLDGDAGVLSKRIDRLDAVFAAYQNERRDYYRMERRWPDALFWRRRHAAGRSVVSQQV